MRDYSIVDAYLESHLSQSLSELSRLVAQPSVGAQNLGLEQCASLVADMLEERGFHAEAFRTHGAPIVLGKRTGASSKTLLVYNHYDVQPPEPLELWDSPHLSPRSETANSMAAA